MFGCCPCSCISNVIGTQVKQQVFPLAEQFWQREVIDRCKCSYVSCCQPRPHSLEAEPEVYPFIADKGVLIEYNFSREAHSVIHNPGL